MKFSEVEPLRADAVESLLGVKLNDGVLEDFGGDAGFALELELVGEVASEVVAVVYASRCSYDLTPSLGISM